MFKRIISKFKKKKSTSLEIGVNVHDCAECMRDSIAHEIKAHFDPMCVQSNLLIKWDKDKQKMLVSKTQLNHLIQLMTPNGKTYDFEFIDTLYLFNKKEGTQCTH